MTIIKKKHKILLLFLHIPLLFIFFLFFLTLFLNIKTEIYIKKDSKININSFFKLTPPFQNLKKDLIKNAKNLNITLKNINITNEQIVSTCFLSYSNNSLSKNDENKKYHINKINNINNLSNINKIEFTIKYNKPFYYKNFTFYQNGISFNFINFKFSLKNKVYDLKKDKNVHLIIDGNEFRFYPIKIINSKEIIFQWILLDSNNKIINQGYFTNFNYTNDSFLQKFDFKIIDLSFDIFNKIEVSYNPFKKYLLYFSLFFLLMLIINFYFYIKKMKTNI